MIEQITLLYTATCEQTADCWQDKTEQHRTSEQYCKQVGLTGCIVMIRYNTIEEFNVDLKAEYSALSSTRNQKLKQMYIKKKLKQTNASAPLIQYR